MSLQALLFDVDGTLADTERLGHRPAYNRAFKELGLSWRWTPRLYRTLLSETGGRERLHHYIQRYKPELGAHADAVRADTERWVRNVHDAKSRHFRKLVHRGEVPLRPGVSRLMREAQAAGIRLAIVSSASRSTLEPLLMHTLGSELASALELIVCGDDVANKKPAPDLYLLALERMALRPEHCVAVEDSAMGLIAADRAGIATVVTVNDNTRHESFDAAMLVVENLGEPDRPAQVVAGQLAGDCVTIDSLRALLPAPSTPRARAVG